MGAAVNPQTQGMLVAMTGSVCLRLSTTDEHLRYVNPWMRWPLLATAVVMIALGFRLLWRTKASPEHEHGPRSAWLLVLPILAVFVISPPALGAYAAERNAVGVAGKKDYRELDADSAIAMTVGEFQGRAQWDDTLLGYSVALTGFVTFDEAGNWYVTKLTMSCCAADAVAYRARVDAEGVERPAEESWVRVTGIWIKPDTTELPRLDPPVIKASEVVSAQQPANPYQ